MRTLSNNRNNAIGPWYVNSNNGPSNANANNWGGRTPTQGGISFFPCPTLQRIVLNHAAETPQLIKGDSVRLAFAPDVRRKARVASQSPLKKRGLVGCLRPLEEARAERDALSIFNRRAAF